MVLQLLYVKALLFGFLVMVVAVGALIRGRSALHPIVALWALFLSIVSFFFVLRGFLEGTPGATHAAQIYVIWPLIYLVLVAGASRTRILKGLQQVLILSTIFIGIQGGVYLLTSLGVLSENRYAELLWLRWEDQSVGLHEGYIGMQFPGLNSLPFLLPFALATLATRVSPGTPGAVRKVGLWLACYSGLFMMVASGRRALILITMLAPLLTWFFTYFKPTSERHLTGYSLVRFIVILVLPVAIFAVGVNLVHQFDMQNLFGRVSEGFDFGATTVDEGGAARHQQYSALLRGWYENPLLGAGHGASAYGSIRSEQRPWEYELSYLALLFQCGVLGFIAYASGVVWIYRKGIEVIRFGGALGQDMLPLLVGMTSYLVVNSVDPYLSRFDGIWAIFLPLAFINYALITRKQGVEFTMKYSSASCQN